MTSLKYRSKEVSSIEQDLSYLTDLQEATGSSFVDDDSLGLMLRKMRKIRDRKDEISAEEKHLNAEYDALNRNVMDIYNARDIQSMKVEGVGTAYRQTTVQTKCINDDALAAWLDERGEGSISKRTVHPATLKSYYKECLENGNEVPPPEIVETFTQEKIVIRKK